MKAQPFLSTSGPHILLVWWTEREQHQIIVARSEAQAEVLWKRRLGACKDAEPRALWQARIVGPSPTLRAAWERKIYEDRVDHFAHRVGGYLCLGPYEDPPEPFPAGVTACTRYETRWPDSADAMDDSESHYDCANCFEGASVGVRVEEFYRRKQYLFDWEEVIAIRADLPEPVQDEPLRIVTLDAGHHRHGIRIKNVDGAPSTDYPVLFFFQGSERPLPSWATAPCAAIAVEQSAREGERTRLWEEEQAAQRKTERDFLAKLLDVEKVIGGCGHSTDRNPIDGGIPTLCATCIGS